MAKSTHKILIKLSFTVFLYGWLEKPLASIVIAFADNTKPPLTVDAAGMGLILAAINKTNPVAVKPARSTYKLDVEEIADHRDREHRLKELINSGLFGGLICSLFILYSVLTFDTPEVGVASRYATLYHVMVAVGQSIALGIGSGLFFFLARKKIFRRVTKI